MSLERFNRRAGPRPLPLHLAGPMLLWLSSLAALPRARSGSLDWSPALRPAAEALASELDRADPDALGRAVGAEALARIRGALAGIEAYRRHPYKRDVEDPPVVWSQGTTKLRDFGGEGRPVLMIPSLVNRWHTVDISDKRSFMRRLRARGFRPLLVDWDAPGEAEKRFDLTDYVAGRANAAFDAARALVGGRKIDLMGYCMGGDLALALALRRQDDLASVSLHATPWDFHAEKPGLASLFFRIRPWMEGVIAGQGELPLDMLQAFFLAIDPALSDRKFRRFATLGPETDAAREFVLLEDWLNDGTPLAAEVARTCLFEWYGENATALRRWRIGGRIVDPAELRVPAFVVAPGADKLVPPASARALGRAIPGAVLHEPPLGHIGMMVGGGGEKLLVEPLVAWLDGVGSR